MKKITSWSELYQAQQIWTHVYVSSKLFDFSYLSKTKILKKKKNPIFLPHPPSEGGTKKMKILKGGRRA